MSELETAKTEVEQARDELAVQLENCRTRESESLEFVERMTMKTAQLQAENSRLTTELSGLAIENKKLSESLTSVTNENSSLVICYQYTHLEAG